MSIAYGGIIAFLFRGVNVLVAFGIVWVTSGELGDAGRGTFVLGLTFVGIITAIAGGLTASAAYQVANRGRPPFEVLASGAIPVVITAVACVTVGVALNRSLSGEGSTLALTVGIAAAAVLCNSLVAGVLLGSERFIRYNLALILPPLFALIAIGVAIWGMDRATPGASLAAYAVGQWSAVPLLLLFAVGRRPVLARPNTALTRALLLFAGAAAVSGTISFLNYRADLFVVEYFAGREGVGVYGNAVYVAEAVWQMSMSLALAAYARVAAADPREAADLTARLMRHTLLGLGVICVVLFLAAGIIVEIFFPPEFSGMTTPLRILLPGTLIYGLGASLSGYYTYQRGQPWFPSLIAGIALIIDIALAIALVPVMGESGAALATTISYILAMAVALVLFASTARLSLIEVFRFGRRDVDDYRVLVRRLRTLVQRG